MIKVKELKVAEVSAVTEREMTRLFESSITLSQKIKLITPQKEEEQLKKFIKIMRFVKKGELVVEFSDASTKATYLQANANYQSAKSSFDIARKLIIINLKFYMKNN